MGRHFPDGPGGQKPLLCVCSAGGVSRSPVCPPWGVWTPGKRSRRWQGWACPGPEGELVTTVPSWCPGRLGYVCLCLHPDATRSGPPGLWPGHGGWWSLPCSGHPPRLWPVAHLPVLSRSLLTRSLHFLLTLAWAVGLGSGCEYVSLSFPAQGQGVAALPLAPSFQEGRTLPSLGPQLSQGVCSWGVLGPTLSSRARVCGSPPATWCPRAWPRGWVGEVLRGGSWEASWHSLPPSSAWARSWTRWSQAWFTLRGLCLWARLEPRRASVSVCPPPSSDVRVTQGDLCDELGWPCWLGSGRGTPAAGERVTSAALTRWPGPAAHTGVPVCSPVPCCRPRWRGRTSSGTGGSWALCLRSQPLTYGEGCCLGLGRITGLAGEGLKDSAM
ncbi:uncharacterized protein AAES06_019804 [Glossophaga mutica]